MNKFVKAAIVVVCLASFGSVGYAAFLTKDLKTEPSKCEAGWCLVKQTVVLSDGTLEQTEAKVWVGQ